MGIGGGSVPGRLHCLKRHTCTSHSQYQKRHLCTSVLSNAHADHVRNIRSTIQCIVKSVWTICSLVFCLCAICLLTDCRCFVFTCLVRVYRLSRVSLTSDVLVLDQFVQCAVLCVAAWVGRGVGGSEQIYDFLLGS